ncbi:redoxin domain-containing protein [Halobaculum rubrum]|nr:redoxin domain-containing protein [Halobaculum rubrum]
MWYPFDFSPVCPDVLRRFRDAEWLSVTDVVGALGISRDPCSAHKRFIQEYEISSTSDRYCGRDHRTVRSRARRVG